MPKQTKSPYQNDKQLSLELSPEEILLNQGLTVIKELSRYEQELIQLNKKNDNVISFNREKYISRIRI